MTPNTFAKQARREIYCVKVAPGAYQLVNSLEPHWQNGHWATKPYSEALEQCRLMRAHRQAKLLAMRLGYSQRFSNQVADFYQAGFEDLDLSRFSGFSEATAHLFSESLELAETHQVWGG